MSPGLKPVSKTAYYCCGVRAVDARQARPVCGDSLAERFMTPEGWQVFESFRDLAAPNASNVTRHRMIDDLLRTRIQRRRDVGIVILGAGFDTRAFRLPGGQWVELDEPAVIAAKEAALPARDAPNPLTRVSIAFEREPLEDALAPFRTLPDPIVVLEGVMTYLAATDVERMLGVLRETFGRLTLICDISTPAFQRRYGAQIGERLLALGAQYGRLDRDPIELLQAAGFVVASRESIIGRAARNGTLRVPRWLLATLLRILRDGYTIALLESGPAPSPRGDGGAG